MLKREKIIRFFYLCLKKIALTVKNTAVARRLPGVKRS